MRRSRVAGLTASALAVALVLAGSVVALRRQAAIARRRIGKPHGDRAPASDRLWRRKLDGQPVQLLVLGDSVAAGLGAERRKDTPGARLAKGLARSLARPVRLRTAAIVGAESGDLARQLASLPQGYRPDVALIIVGGNDVTHRIPFPLAAARLRDAIERLRGLGAVVVVGTCPDLGALHAVPQPLRSLLSRSSRRLAETQAAAATAAGAWTVSLRDAVGEYFTSEPDEAFSLDRFHPSALGYRRTADAILPVMLDALARPRSLAG